MSLSWVHLGFSCLGDLALGKAHVATMCMGGKGQGLSNFLLAIGFVRLHTILHLQVGYHNYGLGTKPPLMCGPPILQSIWSRKIMVG